MTADLSKPGAQEPAGMIERHDLTCRRCGSFALENPRRGEFRFSCARYWRGPWSSHCWCCAHPERGFDQAVPTLLDLMEAAS